MRIGLDVMGGDFAPESIIEGAVDSLQYLLVTEKLVLIGDEPSVLRKLKEMQIDLSLFDVVHTSQVIEMADHPAKASRKKKTPVLRWDMKCLRMEIWMDFAVPGTLVQCWLEQAILLM